MTIDEALDAVAKAVDSRGSGLLMALRKLEAAIRSDERARLAAELRGRKDAATNVTAIRFLESKS